ncbi:hypothetical protein [Aeromonas eucrenophila]|uniref:Uncharacterized protein n=1 Tax=Aeromonas eucrenophila TaxID=649 RepID=A0ABW0YHZ2_9GAMM|nr:hypothetical protein [Aeromonas eucrenophila]
MHALVLTAGQIFIDDLTDKIGWAARLAHEFTSKVSAHGATARPRLETDNDPLFTHEAQQEFAAAPCTVSRQTVFPSAQCLVPDVMLPFFSRHGGASKGFAEPKSTMGTLPEHGSPLLSKNKTLFTLVISTSKFNYLKMIANNQRITLQKQIKSA